MKKILTIIVLTLLLTSCGESECDKSWRLSEEQYTGKHLLRKISSHSSQESSISGGYFLIGGSISGESREITTIKFCWKNNDGDYEFMSIEPSAIKIHLDSAITSPYIRFSTLETSYECKWNVKYITVYCKDEDFPKDIKLNSL